jgi:hypothetical protein
MIEVEAVTDEKNGMLRASARGGPTADDAAGTPGTGRVHAFARPQIIHMSIKVTAPAGLRDRIIS